MNLFNFFFNISNTMSSVPRLGYWLYKIAPNVYKIGINHNVFKPEFHNTNVEHVYIDCKLKRKRIQEYTYLGTLMNENYEAIHFHSPLRGRVVNINHSLSYNKYLLKDFIDKDNWLFSIKLDS